MFSLQACKTSGNKAEAVKPDREKLEITTIDGFPEGIIGCSCYFAESMDDFKAQRFIYLEKYGAVNPEENIVIVFVNGEEVRYEKGGEIEEGYHIEIEYDQVDSTAYETMKMTGTLTVSKGEVTSTKSFTGVCGC